MGRAQMIDRFEVGEVVMAPVSFVKIPPDLDKDGNVIKLIKQTSPAKTKARILKLHKSGRYGVAEMRPLSGGKKFSRRLHLVDKCRQEED